jgi:hypothetical protein
VKNTASYSILSLEVMQRDARFEVFTTIKVQVEVFWVVTQCSALPPWDECVELIRMAQNRVSST